MPKFTCRCGYVMNLSDGSNNYEYSFLSENKINKILWILDKTNNRISDDEFIEIVDSDRVRVLCCPQCERFWLENEDGSYNSYVKETE
ncbi:hypothetical protein [Limnobaculum xujianqingii]|uniref:hypothetical protein n=1 Tax=Limnobaculum xujianqingii TaxID=2738837 RepID=UPI0011267E77|nr:hypothetical protein [Limnobaculum xujianqingii]